jgi:hypothetical protein
MEWVLVEQVGIHIPPKQTLHDSKQGFNILLQAFIGLK